MEEEYPNTRSSPYPPSRRHSDKGPCPRMQRTRSPPLSGCHEPRSPLPYPPTSFQTNHVVPPRIMVAPDSPPLRVPTSTAPNNDCLPNSRNRLRPFFASLSRSSSRPAVAVLVIVVAPSPLSSLTPSAPVASSAGFPFRQCFDWGEPLPHNWRTRPSPTFPTPPPVGSPSTFSRVHTIPRPTESMTSDTILNVDEVGKGEVGEVVILVDRMVGAKEHVLRRRIRDRPTRSP